MARAYVTHPSAFRVLVLASLLAAISTADASIVKRHLQGVRGGWRPVYAGGGIGSYHFGPTTSAPYSRPWRFGIHGFAGLEVLIPQKHIAISAEVQLHMPGVPRNTAGPGNCFGIASVSLGLKFRM